MNDARPPLNVRVLIALITAGWLAVIGALTVAHFLVYGLHSQGSTAPPRPQATPCPTLGIPAKESRQCQGKLSGIASTAQSNTGWKGPAHYYRARDA